MKLSELFDSDAFFRSTTEIKKWIYHSKNYEGENVTDTKILNFFKTSKQRTYLVATKNRLYCILDDSRKDEPHINWSMPKKDVLTSNSLLISIKSKDKSTNTGLVDISEKHKNWLYSKKLFLEKNIETSIKEFITSSMLNT